MLFPILITTLLAFTYLLTTYPNKELNLIELTKNEMILVSLMNLFFFFLFFLIVPSMNSGRTIFKILLGVKLEVKKKTVFESIFLRELFIVVLPSIVVLLFPFTFSEEEFSGFFKGNFITNWSSDIDSLGYRVTFFVFGAFYFFSLITIFVTKKRKTLYDFIGSTWVYIEKKDVKKIEKEKPLKKNRRAGEFSI